MRCTVVWTDEAEKKLTNYWLTDPAQAGKATHFICDATR
jgi:hypothetical protein